MEEAVEHTMSARIALVRRRIEAACHRVGRDPGTVQLVAVSKKQPPEKIREAAACGLTIMGESRVQEAAVKIPLCPGHLRWHLVGHLQTNKAARAARLFDMIHSVDSLKLLHALDRACSETGREVDICLQVNLSGEASKFGMPPEVLPEAIERAARCTHLTVVGLMTIPPLTKDPEMARPIFRQLRAWQTRCAEEYGFPIDGLSIGMSHDFEVAIEEGATWIRVGTALFGKRA